MKVRVALNGTSDNPFAQFGFISNPFPAIADASPKYEYANQLLMIQHQYERVKQEINSWPEYLREIPSYQDLKIEMRQRDMAAAIKDNGS